MRTFTATDFTAERDKVETAEPFLTFVFHFASPVGDVWVCERSLDEGVTYPNTPLVVILQPIGEISSAFDRDFDITDIGDINLKFINLPQAAWDGRRFSDFWSSDFEAINVDLYMNYIRSNLSITREKMQAMIALSPSRFDEELGELTLASRFEKLVGKNVLLTASRDDYPNVRVEDENKPIYLPMGEAPRMQAVKLDDTRPVFTGCESPAENPVTSIDEVRWDDVAIAQQDILAELEDDSDTYTFGILGPVEDGDGDRGYIQQNAELFDELGEDDIENVAFGQGSTGAANGAPYLFTLVQPFIVPSHLVNPRIVGIEVSLGQDPTKNPTQDVICAIISNFISWPVAENPSPSSSDIEAAARVLGRSALNRASIANTSGAGETTPADEVNFQFSGVPVIPGRKLWFQLYPEAGSSHVPQATSEGGSQVFFADYFALSFKTGAPKNGILPMRVFGNADFNTRSLYCVIRYACDGQVGAIEPQNPEGGVASVAAPGFELPIVIEEGRKPIVAWALGASVCKVTGLVGSTVISLIRTSAFGANEEVIGSVEITAAQVLANPGALGSYVVERSPLSPVKLLRPGYYKVRAEGALDRDTGQPPSASPGGHWTFRGFRLASGAWPAGYTPPAGASLGLYRTSPILASGLPVRAGDDDVAIDVHIYALKFDTDVDGIDRSGFAEVEFKNNDARYPVQIPDEARIALDVTCSKRQQDEVIHAWLNRAGFDDSEIDLSGSFAATATKLAAAGYRFDGAVTQQQTYMALLTRASFEARLVVDWQWDKAQLKWAPAPDDNPTIVKVFERKDIRHKGDDEDNPSLDLQVTRSPDSRLVNLVRAFFKLNYHTGNYEGRGRFHSQASMDIYGEKEREDLFKFLYVRDAATFESVCRYWLARLAFKKRILDFKTFLTAFGLEKDDALAVDTRAGSGSGFGEGGFGEGPFGGSSAFAGLVADKPYIAQAVKYDWSKEPRALLVQAEEL